MDTLVVDVQTTEVVQATAHRRPAGRWLVDLTPDEARFVCLLVVIFVAVGRLPADFRAGLDEVRDWAGFGFALATLIVLQNRHRRPPSR